MCDGLPGDDVTETTTEATGRAMSDLLSARAQFVDKVQAEIRLEIESEVDDLGMRDLLAPMIVALAKEYASKGFDAGIAYGEKCGYRFGR